MKRLIRFWKIIVVDTVGAALIVAAILTGWLPGPGGVPLFILGLSLLAIHHDWAKRYMQQIKISIHKLSERVFSNDPKQQLVYDIFCPLLIAGGIYLLWQHTSTWQISAGIFLTLFGIIIFLGNRGRWESVKKNFKRKP